MKKYTEINGAPLIPPGMGKKMVAVNKKDLPALLFSTAALAVCAGAGGFIQGVASAACAGVLLYSFVRGGNSETIPWGSMMICENEKDVIIERNTDKPRAQDWCDVPSFVLYKKDTCLKITCVIGLVGLIGGMIVQKDYRGTAFGLSLAVLPSAYSLLRQKKQWERLNAGTDALVMRKDVNKTPDFLSLDY